MTTQSLTTTNHTTSVVARSTMSATQPAPSAARAVSALLTREGVTDPIQSGPLAGYSRKMVDTIKGSVAKGAPDEQLFMFFALCVQYNLNPFLKEAWCVDMGGGQWMVAPSRDGYLRAARRHPNVKSVTSGVVRKGDEYLIDKVNGHVKHLVAGMGGGGQILGAWCLVIMNDGTRHADDVYLSEVDRGIGAWKQFKAQMVEKCAQSKGLKKAVGLSDLYTSDKIWESIDAEESQALLVDPQESEYVDGFAIGPVIQDRQQPTALLDNGMTDVPVVTNNGPAVNDESLAHQQAMDAIGSALAKARTFNKIKSGAKALELMMAHINATYGVTDVRKLTTEQALKVVAWLTDTPEQLVPVPAATADANPAPIDEAEAARILERERAEAADPMEAAIAAAKDGAA